MGPRPGISAVVPCYEEAAGLAGLTDELAAALAQWADPWEVILVCAEAAADSTPALCHRLAAAQPAVRVVVQSAADPGYGRAVALGLAAARHDWLLLLDGDGQLVPAELGRLVQHTGEADLVVGVRAPRADPWTRRATGALYSHVVSALLSLGVQDVDCAFKLLRRSCLGEAPVRSRTGAVNAELLQRGRARGGRLVEVAVTHRPRAHGQTRFEMHLGIGAHLPHPVEVWSVARDVAALSTRHWRARFHALTRSV